jgi:hypothetical protein
MRRLIVFLSLSVLMLSSPNAFAQQSSAKQSKQPICKTRGPVTKDCTASGGRSCTAMSGDGKESCSVSCKPDESANCSKTSTTADCSCN